MRMNDDDRDYRTLTVNGKPNPEMVGTWVEVNAIDEYGVPYLLTGKVSFTSDEYIGVETIDQSSVWGRVFPISFFDHTTPNFMSPLVTTDRFRYEEEDETDG